VHYKIPLFDLNFDEREEKAIIETLRSKWISTGPKTSEFENLFAEKLKVKYAVALSNCTVALHLSMILADIRPGDEIICPSLTFVATVNAIRYVNAVPVFADICSYNDLTIDPADIERKITPRTKAIVVMHYGGFSCNMEAITNLAQKYNLKIVEDACHGPLSEYNGIKLGTMGDTGCFSFFANKNISTGEGGMLVTNNSEYYRRAKLLRSHGMTTCSFERSTGHSTGYDVMELGYNYRLDDIHSAIGIVQLLKLEEDIKKRTEVRNRYIEALKEIENVIIPFMNHNEISSNYIFPVILKNSAAEKRDDVRVKLEKAGIQTSIHYPAVHRFSSFKNFTCELPNTEYVADNLITLPMYSNLTNEQITYISDSLKQALTLGWA